LTSQEDLRTANSYELAVVVFSFVSAYNIHEQRYQSCLARYSGAIENRAMYKSFRSLAKPPGLSPGTLVHVGQQKAETVKISYIDYDASGYLAEGEVKSVDELPSAVPDPATVSWVNVAGLHQVEVVQAIGQTFGLHPLLLEDILNTEQRPKMEQYDNYLYIILKTIHWLDEPGRVETEQVSIVLGKAFVITFQEQEKNIFDPLRRRIRDSKGRICQLGPDYLAYAVLDIIVDHYFLILENLGEAIERVEEELVTDPTSATLPKINHLKREMLFLRRAIWPLREAIGALQRGDTALFQADTLIYLRDVYEHTIQIIDTIETFRDIVSSLVDIYLSSVSNKTNEVMKLLTLIATIFIPLTFLTSLYGMNFRYMPELEWPLSYPVLWIIMIILGLAMIYYFKKRGWL
jgi:magnesium transporter